MINKVMEKFEIGELVILEMTNWRSCEDDPTCDCADPGTGGDECVCEDN